MHRKINVSLPNNTIISPTHYAYLNMPNLPKAATKVYLFPDIHDRLLLSVAQFCDNGYTVEFNNKYVFILENREIILQGTRATVNGMWFILFNNNNTPPPTTNHLANTLNYAHTLTSKKELIKYYHQCCFCPVKSTWISTIKQGFFATWPGLTVDSVNKYLDKSIASVQSHLK